MANAEAQLFTTSDLLEEGIVQAGLGVIGLSSLGSGFHRLFSSQLLVGDHSRSLHHQTNVPALREWNHHALDTIDSEAEVVVLDELRALLPYCCTDLDVPIDRGGGGGDPGGVLGDLRLFLFFLCASS
ncbi:hypothetical protein Tco_0310009 [Tanacetum coccineum]